MLIPFIEKPPTFVEDPPGPKEHRLEPGAGPKLRCRAEGNPRPEITWYKDGIPIRNSENALVEGFSLKLYNLQESDEGRYMCRVFNKLGSINFTYSITVIGELRVCLLKLYSSLLLFG